MTLQCNIWFTCLGFLRDRNRFWQRNKSYCRYVNAIIQLLKENVTNYNSFLKCNATLISHNVQRWAIYLPWRPSILLLIGIVYSCQFLSQHNIIQLSVLGRKWACACVGQALPLESVAIRQHLRLKLSLARFAFSVTTAE